MTQKVEHNACIWRYVHKYKLNILPIFQCDLKVRFLFVFSYYVWNLVDGLLTFNFCTVGFFSHFTNFDFFLNKDVYPEITTIIEIENKTLKFPLMDFRHLVCRPNTFVFVLKANLYTVDQLNLATAKIGDFVILNILLTAKNGKFWSVRKVDFWF